MGSKNCVCLQRYMKNVCVFRALHEKKLCLQRYMKKIVFTALRVFLCLQRYMIFFLCLQRYMKKNCVFTALDGSFGAG